MPPKSKAAQGTAKTEPSRVRTPNFTNEEDIGIAEPFVRISDNSVKRNKQKSDTVWRNIFEAFEAFQHEMIPDNELEIRDPNFYLQQVQASYPETSEPIQRVL